MSLLLVVAGWTGDVNVQVNEELVVAGVHQGVRRVREAILFVQKCEFHALKKLGLVLIPFTVI